VSAPARTTERRLDLAGVPCPLNWVRVRLALEDMDPGEALVALVDEGEPRESVARSAAEDAHEVRSDGDGLRIVRR
jgi:tRNA 2-thiouridine synthesizing protein A